MLNCLSLGHSWILLHLAVYIYLFFIAFFSRPSLLLCEIESQLPDLSKGQSCWLNPTPFPPISLLLSLLWGPSNSRPSSAFLSHTAPSNRAALGLKQPPQHSTSQLEERSHCEKMQASSNPAPVMTGRRQLGALRGADWYMQHISPLSQSPQLSHHENILNISRSLSWNVWLLYYISSLNNYLIKVLVHFDVILKTIRHILPLLLIRIMHVYVLLSLFKN